MSIRVVPPGGRRYNAPWPAPPAPVRVRSRSDGVEILVGQDCPEWFTIRSQVDLADGRILAASMDNRLDLHLLGGCDADWTGCLQDGPIVIEREEQFVVLE